MQDLRGFEWRYLWKKCQGDQLHTFYDHSNAVRCVAFSHDGTVLASGDDAGMVILWNVDARRRFATLAASAQPIVRVSFSKDGQTLASGDKNGMTKVWSLTTRKVVWTHQGRNADCIQISPGQTLIGVSSGAVTRGSTNVQYALVVDWTTGKEVLRVGPLASFEAFSPDGRLAFIIRSGRTELWELATGKLVKTIPDNTSSLFVSPDGRHFASFRAERRDIFLVDLAGDNPPARIQFSSSTASALAFSRDSARLASAESDQGLRLWDVATQRETGRLLGHVDRVTGVAFSPDGKLLATSSADRTVMLWPTAKQPDSEIIFNAWEPYILSPDGKSLAGFDDYRGSKAPTRVTLWDIATHQATALSKPGEGLVPEFFSADSRTLVARGAMASNGVLPLLRWDLNALTNPPRMTRLDLKRTNAFARSAAAPDGRVYAISQLGTKEISLWNPLTGEAAGRLHDSLIQWGIGEAWTFSPDGQTLVSHVWPNLFRLSSLATPDQVIGTNVSPADFFHLAFSPDGRIVAAACADHTIRLWDAATLKEVGILSGHQRAVIDVAFSPDGRTLASCGQGGVVKLWCWPARREVATLIRGAPECSYVAFTSDGNTLLAGSWGRVYLWRAPSLAEIEREPGL